MAWAAERAVARVEEAEWVADGEVVARVAAGKLAVVRVEMAGWAARAAGWEA